MTIRVLMIGPGEGAVGGILTLAETLVPALEQYVDLLYFPTVKRSSLKGSGKISLRNISLALHQYVRFLFALYRFRPQIVHLHTSQGIAWLKDSFYVVLAKILHCHVVLHVHAADFDELYEKKSPLIQYYTRKVMELAGAIVAVSEVWRKRLGDIVPIDRIFTFKNCIAVDVFSPHSLHRSRNGVRALFLGSVGPRKGAFDLLEAMGYLKSSGCSLQVWIAGDEEREGDLLRASTRLEELRLKDLCELLGTVRGEKKAELLSKASLFILPSYDEGLPMAVLEAMAAGLAVVSTPVGGIPEVVRDGYNGFLVPPGDIDALVEKLLILASDPDLREVMGRRSHEIAVRDLDVKPYVRRLVALYESLIGVKPASRI